MFILASHLTQWQLKLKNVCILLICDCKPQIALLHYFILCYKGDKFLFSWNMRYLMIPEFFSDSMNMNIYYVIYFLVIC